ncbi:MAG: 1,4-alpha-glucan branching protein GlgB [Candidatus Izemoplasmatales bacterium]
MLPLNRKSKAGQQMTNHRYDFDISAFLSGLAYSTFRFFGAKLITDERNQIVGGLFTTYAPSAKSVSVVGDFNNWDRQKNIMDNIDESGIYQQYIPGIKQFDNYKYAIVAASGKTILKADPYAYYADIRPDTASKIYNLDGYEWHDDRYLQNRRNHNTASDTMAIYEVHLGSWMTQPTQTVYKYNEFIGNLLPYAKNEGFTHIELMPITEHPLDESWGYQTTGYYAATSRYGTPKELMNFIDECHQNGIGVIMDWIPGHTCKDEHGLTLYDGEPLYEYSDSLIRENVIWGTANLDLSKGITRSFLISNAIFWIEYFHIDGFRIDAVSNMIYYLGNPMNGTNYPAIDFLKQLSVAVKQTDPSVLLIAEDSTDYPAITKPVAKGGVGFDYKWNMGWMNDTLSYFELDPLFRKHHHKLITFGLVYAFSEKFILPLSHDEVVHGKRSLIEKMPGDNWQKFANYRALLGLQFAHPGKKLLFMGNEFAQVAEWRDKSELDWPLLDNPIHSQAAKYVKDLMAVYKYHKAFFELDHDSRGFRWIDADNKDQSVFAFVRYAKDPTDFCVIIINMTPVSRERFTIGVPKPGAYEEILNSDKDLYGGSNVYNGMPVNTIPQINHNFNQSITIKLAPLSIAIFQYNG